MAADKLTTDEFARWWHETGEHELRQLLLWRWDPIGVADYFPNTVGEPLPRILTASQNR